MNQNKTIIRRALLSVSDKTHIIELARALVQRNIEIISTGGTAQLLRSVDLPVRDVADITHFPEIMDGRVKTLHPQIHGGILGLRDQHAEIAAQHKIGWIDLVVVNLYPFASVIQQPHIHFDQAIENIDIGGPTLIRAAAKNMEWATVVVDPADYEGLLTELDRSDGIEFSTRQQLAVKAFSHTAHYDRIIYHYLSSTNDQFPDELPLILHKKMGLRYGENPHQMACAYQLMQENSMIGSGPLAAKQHQGKPLSYNNIVDTDAAIRCLEEFTSPACVVIKHATPCGVAVAETSIDALQNALAADPQSAFGGIIALNRVCNEAIVQCLQEIFIEVLIAPSYTAGALALLLRKSNLRVLEFAPTSSATALMEFKFIQGGCLLQEQDVSPLTEADLQVVTPISPSSQDWQDLLFAWQVVKHIKSNAILIAKEGMTVGIGAGQVSRIDAVNIALTKAGERARGAVLASDAFFPFRDSIDQLQGRGIRAIIQPGGSIRDQEVIAACHQHKIAMVLTGKRCFKH